jgi:putative effector of murein hydrolase
MSPQLPEIREIWVYLSGSPLLALTLTLAAWQLGTLAYERSGGNPLVNPLATAVGMARLLGVDAPLQQDLWAKSVTAPIAMAWPSGSARRPR